jgi:hypothetical protein
LVSAALRVALVFGGGQFYWPDEHRYDQSRKIIADLEAGRPAEALARVDNGLHPLFRVIGIAPALVERVLVTEDLRIPGLFFASFSVLNIWLIGRVAASLGASPATSLLASLLFAIANSTFYFSRHLAPYDVAMALALIALHLGLSTDPRPGRRFLAGWLAGIAFLTYNGYWTLDGAVLALPLLYIGGWRRRVMHVAWAGGGLVTSLLMIIGLSALGRGALFGALFGGASDDTQGFPYEGYRLPFAYFWHAEHGIFIVWLAAFGWACWRVVAGPLRGPRPTRQGSSPASPLLVIGVTAIIGLYLAMTMFSTGLELFTVHGRLARQYVPFFVLLTAGALEARPAAAVAVALMVAQAAINFVPPLRLTFPIELAARLTSGDVAPGRREGAIWVNFAHLHPGPEAVTVPPGHVAAATVPHPLSYVPYLYEGFTPPERLVLRTADIRMRLMVPPN